MTFEFKLDKTAIRKFKVGDEPLDHHYWLQQTPEIRIAGIELLRRQYYGEAPFKRGLQRFYQVTEQK